MNKFKSGDKVIISSLSKDYGYFNGAIAEVICVGAKRCGQNTYKVKTNSVWNNETLYRINEIDMKRI